MEVYVSNISSWATQLEIETELANALQSAPVRHANMEDKINFHLVLPKKPNGSHKGFGFLTIPNYLVAMRFLEKCAGHRTCQRPVTLRHSNTLCFKPNGHGDARLIERLVNEPYFSPEERESARKQKEISAEAKPKSSSRTPSAKSSKPLVSSTPTTSRTANTSNHRGNGKPAVQAISIPSPSKPILSQGPVAKSDSLQQQSQSKRETVGPPTPPTPPTPSTPPTPPTPDSLNQTELKARDVSQQVKSESGEKQAQKPSSPTASIPIPTPSPQSVSPSSPLTEQQDASPHVLDPDILPSLAWVASKPPKQTSNDSPRTTPKTSSRQPRNGASSFRPVLGKPGSWKSIGFGVICDDGSFSVEDEEVLQHPLEARFEESVQSLTFGNDDFAVKIVFNSVVRWSVGDTTVLFELEHPATFVVRRRVASCWNFKGLPQDDDVIQDRIRYRAPYIANNFRVTFVSENDLNDFLLHGRAVLLRAGIPQERRRYVKKNLLNPLFFHRIHKLCARIQVPLAFQVEKLFLNGLCSPSLIAAVEIFVSHSLLVRSWQETARMVSHVAANLKHLRVTKFQPGAMIDQTRLTQIFTFEAKNLQLTSPEDDVLAVGLGATFEVHHVTVTPTKVFLAGPIVDTSNRVLRLFPNHTHHFLRVAFAGEDLDRFSVGRKDLRGCDSESFVHERIGNTLKQGLFLAGRRWDMLAWSGSSIGNHQCWFCTPFEDDQGKRWDAELIRQNLGDFSKVEFYPARYGARLSQAFSATAPTIPIRPEWIETIDDIKSKDGHLFTDGCGQISPELMKEVWEMYCHVKMRVNEQRREVMAAKVPSAIQIRMGGAKGVLSINPSLKGKVIRLRPSMVKFEAPNHVELEVATSSLHPLPTRLNRPLINALEDLGVGKENFLLLQREAVSEAESARKSFLAASELCRKFAFGTAVNGIELFRRLHQLVQWSPEETIPGGFFSRLTNISIAAALGDLKRKARIPVAGPTLIGVADEFGFLGKDEIFAQVEEKDGRIKMIEGKVLIGRSPTIHPGDVCMVKAVVPSKSHPLRLLKNVVVFSCHANGRSLQNKLGGGDLDGDIYSLYQEPLLFPKKRSKPGDYEQPKNKKLNRPCTRDDLADFFTDFVINDQIGIVSYIHLSISDSSHLHSFDPSCIKLAKLHSQAVDFRKTGQAVHRQDIPYKSLDSFRPDYLSQTAPTPVNNVYESERALGHLYREIAWGSTDMPQGPHMLWDLSSLKITTAVKESETATPSGTLNDGTLPDLTASEAVLPTDPSPKVAAVMAIAGKAMADSQRKSVVANTHSGSTSTDFDILLNLIAKRFPYALPTPEVMKTMHQRYKPLLDSFVYHLSRIAAWIPETRVSAEWLSEEEIILGLPIMTTKAKLKRWQDRLQSATSELFPIVRFQLFRISEGAPAVVIRPAKSADPDSVLNHLSFSTMFLDRQERVITNSRIHVAEKEKMAARSELFEPLPIEDEEDKMDEVRESVEGEVMHPKGLEKRKGDIKQIGHLYAACLLGSQDPMARAYGGETFALIALSCLLELIEEREKESALQHVRALERIHRSGRVH